MARTTHARRWPRLLTCLSLEIAALAYGWMLSPGRPDPAPFIAWPRPPVLAAGDESAYGLYRVFPRVPSRKEEAQYALGLLTRALLFGCGWALVQVGRPPLRRRFRRVPLIGWESPARSRAPGARALFLSEWEQPVATCIGALESRALVPRDLRPARRLYWAGWVLAVGAALALVAALAEHDSYRPSDNDSNRINAGTITMPQLDGGGAAAAALAGASILGAAWLLLRRSPSVRCQINFSQLADTPAASPPPHA